LNVAYEVETIMDVKGQVKGLQVSFIL
jgi:hypothetical protein